jgi:hypothetical protein
VSYRRVSLFFDSNFGNTLRAGKPEQQRGGPGARVPGGEDIADDYFYVGVADDRVPYLVVGLTPAPVSTSRS